MGWLKVSQFRASRPLPGEIFREGATGEPGYFQYM